MAASKFMFATGIENSYPTIQLPNGTIKRVDELEKTGHYQHWQQDFELVKEMGIEFLRYGPPYYRTHVGPDQYDWEFTDLTFNRLRELNITPIVDLCHFGVPDWMGGFLNPDFPRLFASYCRAFTLRFPYIQLYTPINEIYVAAMFSAQNGWWNDRKASDRDFVTALKTICKANVLGMLAILEVQPEATFIQSESSEYFHTETPSMLEKAHHMNEKRFLSLDLTYGYPVSVTMYEFLLDNGMTRDEYHWFGQTDIKAKCVMGNDYYRTNEHLLCSDGSVQPAGDMFGYYVVTKQYYDRYRLPVMHTETNLADPQAVNWLKRQWANAHRLKQDGVPLIGFTWYSLLDQVDWDTALREDNNRVNPLGLYDLNRKIRPVGVAYKALIESWKDVLEQESYGIHLNYR
ncbi:glycoside hydrolase family 1 protein [Hymenobacter busanensis]|uniref:Glycoside hydrolase family 1 protein n=1 Tax=Hymenobacter busanensis TaxID=2607656 RepID=A0A7L4ZZ43_9BACT|nr:family 1 glycosylhydrolase [Hymenobacter busanensis]KAA9331638.1 glycoside hydrolase family 1 protein [Hymenobacter busanensis]QHJ08789.1 family 1 glycosylhydrolase [Hymenobacter busanensis]